MNLRDDNPAWPGGWRGWLITAAVVIAVAVFALRCLGCARSPVDPDGPAGLSGWRVTDGAGSLAADGAGWRLDVPRSPQVVGYVQALYVGGAPHGEVSAAFEVALSPDAAWYTPGDDGPAQATLLLESRSGGRLWAGGSRVRLDSPGSVTVSAPLEWRAWTGVYGRSDEAEFNNLLAHLGSVGVTFGGANFYGHGVGLSAGSATVRLISLRMGA